MAEKFDAIVKYDAHVYEEGKNIVVMNMDNQNSSLCMSKRNFFEE